MNVILDANAIIRDYWLRGRAARRLLGQARAEEVDLVVPHVVVAEVLKHFRADLQRASAKREEADRTAGRVLRTHQSEAPFDIDALAAEYEQHLRGTLAEAHADIASPTISHADLAARAVARHKPFKKTGEGYQDALIWELVRERARDDYTVLISENSDDFGGNESGGIDEHLEAELRQEGLAGRVERLPSIPAFNAEHLQYAAVYQNELLERLDSAEYAAGVADAIRQALIRDGAREFGSIGSIDDESTNTVIDAAVDDVALLDVTDLGGDEAYASFQAEGEIVLEFPMLQVEAWGAWDDGELEDFALDDPDEAFGQATLRTRYEITADADYDPNTGELDNWEITWATRR